MNLLFDVYQQAGIQQARNDASDAKNAASRMELRVRDLEARMDRMALTCQALWEILSESTGVTIEQVAAQMEQIDRRDGRADGKIGGAVMQCPACGRTVNSITNICIYCGQRIITQHIVR